MIKTSRSTFKEIQDSLSAELNYEIEAQNLEVFKTFHEKLDQQVIIPTVYKDYSSRRVLTLSYEKVNQSKRQVRGLSKHAIKLVVESYVRLDKKFSFKTISLRSTPV